jgi:hypothetical protein
MYPMMRYRWFRYRWLRLEVFWKSLWEYDGVQIGTVKHVGLSRLAEFVYFMPEYEIVNFALLDLKAYLKRVIKYSVDEGMHVEIGFAEFGGYFIERRAEGNYEFWNTLWDEDLNKCDSRLYRFCDWLMEKFSGVKGQ